VNVRDFAVPVNVIELSQEAEAITERKSKEANRTKQY